MFILIVGMAKKKYPQWYKMHGLKHVTGFLTLTEKQKLRMIASAADKSLSRYVTRLLQQHIKDMTSTETEDAIRFEMSPRSLHRAHATVYRNDSW